MELQQVEGRELNQRVFVLSLFLSMPILGSVSASDLDSTIEFTTTADFSSGSFSSSLGQREVNDYDCNQAIEQNAFTLNNASGDGFCVSDQDADTLYWNPCIVSGTGTTSEIESGVLRLSSVGDGGSRHAVRSESSWDGDVIMSIKTNLTIPRVPAETWFQGYNEPVCTFQGSGTVDGFVYQILGTVTPGTYTLTGFSIVDGGVAGCTASPTLNANPIWRRVSRDLVATTWTFAYSTDGVAYDIQGSCVAAGLGSWFTSLEQAPNGNTLIVVDDYDDWLVLGTPDDAVLIDEYRTNGVWTSPEINMVSGQRVARLAIEHSGLSTDSIIDQVDIIIDGGVIESFTGDINVGSETFFYSDSERSGILQVAIHLAGDGALTPTVTSLEIILTEGGAGMLDDSMLSVLLLIVWLALFVIGLMIPSGTVVLIASMAGIVDGVFLFLPVNLIAALVVIGASIITLIAAIRLYMEGND